LFPQYPVKETQRAPWDFDTTGGVDSFVKRKLDTFDQMECYCILETSK